MCQNWDAICVYVWIKKIFQTGVPAAPVSIDTFVDATKSNKISIALGKPEPRMQPENQLKQTA